ncbi:acVLRF1 family peptidyl-tRNA hydrolase [Micromonospora sp. CPCC 206061]|uniref:acVLRF1 family peptidyl-tRNA hydrolase n=1 Tax=Micromonospora sp. CPCC 206061 TaxID=3122410 RepID=UPI002FF1E4ED
MGGRPAAGGGRWVEVDPARLAKWIDGFASRHGPPRSIIIGYAVRMTAPDGTTADLHPPPGAPAPAAVHAPDVDLAGFLTAVTAPRRIGLLLARAGAVAVGVADGDRLVASKVETRYVQGRTAAGGWSQQRFARRRANQAKASANEAVDLAVRVLLPAASSLAALVCGGDRRTIDTILSDPRLAPLGRLRADRHLPVAEPRHAVLLEAVTQSRAIHILVRDPTP